MADNFDKLPNELRQLVQWVVWRYETTIADKPTKVPYNPRTGQHASTTNPQTWSTFELAVAAVRQLPDNYNGIGFVFTDRDEYCGIDLDELEASDREGIERQELIFNKIVSYAERSPSGKGLHIITKARVPHGRKRHGIEVYSSDRYFTMTGDVFRGGAINDNQELVNILWTQLGQSAEPSYYAGDFTEHHTDDEIYTKAARAVNGEKFEALWRGEKLDYPTQSEADFALVDILAFYTKHRIQLQRLFLSSGAGKREKYTNANAQRQTKLIGYMISKSFDRMLPPVDLSGVIDQINAALAAPQVAEQPPAPEPTRAVGATLPPAPSFTFDGFETNLWRQHYPPGILGQLTSFIYQQAPRPVYEIALAGALGLMAGITGRAFNVSGTGLNHYLMLLADTGAGKEAMASGIDKIIKEVTAGESKELTLPSAQHFIGPAEIASGQALLKHLGERPTPCFMSLTGEFGLRLQQMSSHNANSSELALRRVMLDLYNKSGAGKSVHPTIYSDKAKNTEVVHSPAFTLLGESTPETFYRALDEESVIQGLLPRFLIIEYNGPRVPMNPTHTSAIAGHELVRSISNLSRMCHENMLHSKVIHVGATAEAANFLDHCNTYADAKINAVEKNALKQLWNRFHVKCLKLAGLLAVANNTFQPMIDLDMAKWAASLVISDTMRLLHKFNAGEIGQDSDALDQDKSIRQALVAYLTEPYSAARAYMVDPGLHDARIIPYGYIQRKLVSQACFRKDKRGSTNAIKSSIQVLIDGGLLQEVPGSQLREQHKFNGRAYVTTNVKALLGSV